MRPPSADDEQGAVLILAVVFILVIGLVSIGLLNLSTTNILATTHLKAVRTANYAADGAMEAAIATIRMDPNAGFPSSTTSCGQTPPSVNGTSYRVDCYPVSAPEFQREVVLEVCPIGSPSPCDSVSPLRATVLLYDFPSVGASVSIQNWSAVQ
jgi:Tfp pilus assembly protein PilX